MSSFALNGVVKGSRIPRSLFNTSAVVEVGTKVVSLGWFKREDYSGLFYGLATRINASFQRSTVLVLLLLLESPFEGTQHKRLIGTILATALAAQRKRKPNIVSNPLFESKREPT